MDALEKISAGFQTCVHALCCVCCCAGLLTKEAVDDSKQATHGADDGRDDVILPLYLQSAGIDLGHACPGGSGARPRGICHPGSMPEAQLGCGCSAACSGGGVTLSPSHPARPAVGGDKHIDSFRIKHWYRARAGRKKGGRRT